MVDRMSSLQLMQVLDKAEGNMGKLRNEVNAMRSELDVRLSVFSNAMEFATDSIGRLDELSLQKDNVSNSTIVLTDMEILEGNYEKFGLSVHPSFRSNPNNIFNFQAATGAIFKNNANIYLDNESAPEHIPMLMHDGIKGKGTSFVELDRDFITLRIEINPGDLYGSTAFNTIEFLPYIPGSMDIMQMRFYTMMDYRSKASAPTLTLSNTVPRLGAQRMILEDSMELYAMEIDLGLKFKNSAGKYPFGFRHIYFLNANYQNECSILFKISRRNYIDWVSDAITIHDQDGIRQTSCTEEGIKIYTGYSLGVLSQEIATTRGAIQNSIPRNVRELYILVPIAKGMSSIKFQQIGEK